MEAAQTGGRGSGEGHGNPALQPFIPASIWNMSVATTATFEGDGGAPATEQDGNSPGL